MMLADRHHDVHALGPIGGTSYISREIGALIEASEKVCELESRASPAISVVRSRA
jgi:hypothetical protein